MINERDIGSQGEQFGEERDLTVFQRKFGVLDADFLAQTVSSINLPEPLCVDVSESLDSVMRKLQKHRSGCALVLDEDGSVLADMAVTVVRGPNRNIAVYRGSHKSSYACAPKCESTLQVGDSRAYFEAVQDSILKKMGLAAKAGRLTIFCVRVAKANTSAIPLTPI